jgi:prepilin-type N-terminal cleavage/methylation domain-containing protein
MGGCTTKRRGFSLIELLVVIAIMAVLAGIIFPMAGSLSEKSHQSACIGNLQSIGQALKLYRLDERAYPPALYGFLVEGDSAPTTFLYPHYARSRREFKCPSNRNAFDETKMGGPFEGSSLPTAVPQERVARQGGGYDLEPITKSRIAYYLFDSYDGGVIPPLPPAGPTMVSPTGTPRFELHYRRDWASLYNIPTTNVNANREMLLRNPEDSTFVTACTYHRTYHAGTLDPDSWDMVLFLDGHTEKIPSKSDGWTVTPLYLNQG